MAVFRRLVEIDFGPKAWVIRIDGPSYYGLGFSERDEVALGMTLVLDPP